MNRTLCILALAALCLAACAESGDSGDLPPAPPAPPALVITTAALPQAVLGQGYTEQVVATGGTGAGFQWVVSTGALPAGLVLSGAGTPAATIAGTPTAAGTFHFDVQVTDSASAVATQSLQIVVTVTPLAVTSAPDMPDGTVGQAYSESLTAADGSGSGYTWAVIDGELPPGLTLGASGTPSTTIAGTPTAFGRFYFTVEVTDSAANTATLDMNLIVVVSGSADTWPASFNLAQDRGDCAVFTGSRILQFGGEFSAASGGEVMFPGLGIVSAMSTTNEPAARNHHTLVWTGRNMIVFGGQDGGTFFRDGGSYNPVTDTWTAISTTGAPSARANHTAVWTGTEMIIWGGHDSAFNPLKDGAAYNPATDTWRSLAAAPTGLAERERHAAVWTGTSMIVWGGFGTGSTEYYDGAVYDPAGDSWTGITDTGAPTVQPSQSTVLWTGSKLFVWGADTSAFMQGATWDSNTNTWTSIGTWSIIRREPAGCATSYGVFIWGGLDHFGTFAQNDGENYYDNVQNWLPMAASPLGGRFNVKAYWTGRQVIVWGGKDFGFAGTQPQSNGAVYNP